MRRSGGKNPICYNLSPVGAKHGLIHFNVSAKHCSESQPFPVFPAPAEPDVDAESEIPESIFFTLGGIDGRLGAALRHNSIWELERRH